MKKMNKKGFTMVELVIVIAVIAILSAVTIPVFSNLIDEANANKALQEIKNAYTATLADDLLKSEKVVYEFGKNIVVEHSNGTVISIDTDGVPSVVTEDEPEITHELENGKLILWTQNDEG